MLNRKQRFGGEDMPLLKSKVNSDRFVFIFFALLIFLVYANSIGNQFVSDDIAAIVNNPFIGDLGHIFPSWTSFSLRPILYYIAFNLGGLNSALFRLISIFLHLGTTFLIYKLGDYFFNKKITFLAACVFAVHPILVESVVWISGGNYTQAAFLTLLSFYLFLSSSNYTWKYFLSVIVYFFSVTSQLTSLALIPLLFLCYFFRKDLKIKFGRLIPFVFLGVYIIFIYSHSLPERANTLVSVNYEERGVDNPLLVIPLSIVNYLILFIWPSNLTIYHSEMSYTQLQYFAILLVFGLSVLLYLISFRKNKHVFIWLTFSFASLLPTLISAVFRLTWIVAERYVYMGAIGVFLVVSYYLNKLFTKEKYAKIFYIIFFILIIALSTRTIFRNIDWQDQDHLWMAASFTSPSSPTNHNNLGDMYGRHGNQNRAITEFQTAIALKPNYADAYHNLGNAYQSVGEFDKALESYKKALEINPYLWQSYQNIAAIDLNQKKYDEALKYANLGIEKNPNIPNLYAVLGVIYLNMKDYARAKDNFSKTIVLDPNNQLAKQGLDQISK